MPRAALALSESAFGKPYPGRKVSQSARLIGKPPRLAAIPIRFALSEIPI
jgi:hypothetical protein